MIEKPDGYIWLSCSGRTDRAPRWGDRAIPKHFAKDVGNDTECVCGHRKGLHLGWGRCSSCNCYTMFCPVEAANEIWTVPQPVT